MIRTLVVDDDFMAVSVHREFVERVPGFVVVGEATSGRQALKLVDELKPDLVVLDMYLPDIAGTEVLRRVRAAHTAPVDVIAITSAKDVDVLRVAMNLGVVHYIVKPFTFKTFRERFESYAAASSRLGSMHQPGQREIDRLYGLLRTSSEHSLPKGIAAPTVRARRGHPAPVAARDLRRRPGRARRIQPGRRPPLSTLPLRVRHR